METYTQMKARHAKELSNQKGLFFAFDNKQFDEGLKQVEYNKETDKIISIGAGGFILKSCFKDFDNMLIRHKKERLELKNNEKKLIEALVYELGNHEYCITGDPEPALNALGFAISEIDTKILNKAIKIYNMRVN